MISIDCHNMIIFSRCASFSVPFLPAHPKLRPPNDHHFEIRSTFSAITITTLYRGLVPPAPTGFSCLKIRL